MEVDETSSGRLMFVFSGFYRRGEENAGGLGRGGDGLGELCVSVVNSVNADNPLADLESF